MPRVDASSFDTLRMWNGTQSRAFEELSFQLFKDRVPAGTQAIRTGNPDGGVEWYCTLPDGTEWGWQAKHVHGIEALLTAMTDSVKRVAAERPTLRKLTFVISWNLGTSRARRQGRPLKSQRDKYDDKIIAWQRDIPGADQIEFALVQESELVDELAKPQHRGRRWFWWNELVLGPDWLEAQYDQQKNAAGEKYQPDLQVDVPIQEDLLALGFDQATLNDFNRLLRDVMHAVADVHIRTEDEDTAAAALYQALHDAASALGTTAKSLSLQAGDDMDAPINLLVDRLHTCQDAIDAAREYERERKAAWEKLPDDDPGKAAKPAEQADRYSMQDLISAVNALLSWLDSSVGRSFRSRAYFLTGQAGSGKTHLLLDATRRALDVGRPAVFLAGAQFGKSNLWASVTDQLGLEAVGSDVLLRAMDAAGEATWLSGSRFVIFIDALNETTPPTFWRDHLPTLRATIARYPHVALVVSCRDTYQELVLEGTEGSRYVRRAHPGFTGREVEATQKYFAHYGLTAPRIPLLTPEFTLPLFLRLYCESLSQPGNDPIPDGHQGRIAIFERYLTAKVATIARRFRPDAASNYELDAARAQVRRVLDGLLDELSRTGREIMTKREADSVTRSALGDMAGDATRLLGLLQTEGILTRERLYLGDNQYDEGMRIVFQAFADFLLLKRRLARSGDPLNDQAVKHWLAYDCILGITEAAAVLFPEVYALELPDFLRDMLGSEPRQQAGDEIDDASWEQRYRTEQLYRSLVTTLPYRDSRAITQRTIDLLNDAQDSLPRDDFFQVLFTLAPQPSNRLNGDGLHRYLLQHRMPERDSDFGFATYHLLSEEYTPAVRLARWAAAGPYPTYDAEVVELACVPLCWLLSSPNRFMRDWVTKALVHLLRGHLDVMRALVERFWPVDDPYVVQRVMAIAYGALLRSTPAQATEATGLAEVVRALVFTRPVRPDELLLDAARGIVRWAAAHELLPESAWETAQHPYGLTPPGPPPTEENLEAKYGWREGQPAEESYSSITHSVLGLGDFGHYVVESGLRTFSRYRKGQEYPERVYREPRFVKNRWDKFVASLSAQQIKTLAEQLRHPERNDLDPLSFLMRREEDPLSTKQRALLDAVYVYPKRVSDDYPADLGKRWIVRRTLSLGWPPPTVRPERSPHRARPRTGRPQGRTLGQEIPMDGVPRTAGPGRRQLPSLTWL